MFKLASNALADYQTNTLVDYQTNQTQGAFLTGASSVAASYSDPDLLIREYFLASSEQRVTLRTTTVQHISSVSSVMEILDQGASGNFRDSYDGAVNLLTEISDIELLEQTTHHAVSKLYAHVQRPSYRLFVETLLEILIEAIACAYKIEPEKRLNLIQQIFPLIESTISESRYELTPNWGRDIVIGTELHSLRMLHKCSKRIIQTSIIDALVTIADDECSNSLTSELESLRLDSDEYVSRYAREALLDIG